MISSYKYHIQVRLAGTEDAWQELPHSGYDRKRTILELAVDLNRVSKVDEFRVINRAGEVQEP